MRIWFCLNFDEKRAMPNDQKVSKCFVSVCAIFKIVCVEPVVFQRCFAESSLLKNPKKSHKTLIIWLIH